MNGAVFFQLLFKRKKIEKKTTTHTHIFCPFLAAVPILEFYGYSL